MAGLPQRNILNASDSEEENPEVNDSLLWLTCVGILSIILGENTNNVQIRSHSVDELIEEIRREVEEEREHDNDVASNDNNNEGNQTRSSRQDSESEFLGFSPVSDFVFQPLNLTSSSSDFETESNESCPSPQYVPSPPPSDPTPVVVASYGISSYEKIIVQKYCFAFGFEYTDSCTKPYTILVFKGTSTVNNSSFKYLIALAAKAKIVNFEWVLHSIRENRALPEENFLLRDLSFADPNSSEISNEIFGGLNIVTELLHGLNQHEPQAIEHLFRLMGANVISKTQDLRNHRNKKNKFILFLDEKQLDANLLNDCARYSTLAVNFKWVQDSLRYGKRLPVESYLSFTFPLTAETLALYGIDPEEEVM